MAETCHSDERRIKRSWRGQQLLSYPEKGLLECGHHIGAQRADPASGTADVTRFRGANTEHGCLAGGAVSLSQQPIKRSTIEVSLTDFAQRFTAFKAINDLWQQVFDPMQQLRPARVTDSKPDHLRCLARKCHPPEGEAFIPVLPTRQPHEDIDDEQAHPTLDAYRVDDATDSLGRASDGHRRTGL
ncbi:hypothetical protein [Halochromatium roseum]|uniref:hypothetical protein n=1 Tax=Halochromatium roseum TaxID=391920 RepID=UPI00191280F4|nr:hypothetical protein [Halochromatium roseum]